MRVIAINGRKEDFPVAVAQQQDALDPQFLEDFKKLGWGESGTDELLDAQTFAAWYRKHQNEDATLEECLHNTEYCWQGFAPETV